MEVKRRREVDSEEESHLEEVVFGKSRPLWASKSGLSDHVKSAGDVEEDRMDSLFCVDRTGAGITEVDTISAALEEENILDQRNIVSDVDGDRAGRRKPVWRDDDDEFTNIMEAGVTLTGLSDYRSVLPGLGKYKDVLEKRYVDVMGDTPRWASLRDDEKDKSAESCDDEETAILMSVGGLLESRKKKMNMKVQKGKLSFSRKVDLSKSVRSRRRLGSSVLEFHPTSQVAVIGGGPEFVSIIQVDGAKNPLIQDVKVTGLRKGALPRWAHFTKDGNRLLVGSETSYRIFSYDLMVGRSVLAKPFTTTDKGYLLSGIERVCLSGDGKWIGVLVPLRGCVYILSAASLVLIDSLQSSGPVRSGVFSHDGSRLWTHGDEGRVCEWDLRQRKCVGRFVDEGCMTGLSLAASPNGQMLACGSDSGIVNVYDILSTHNSTNPKPAAVIQNLTTECNQLVFNHSSEILAMASGVKEEAVRLWHARSNTVFENFPAFKSNIKCPQSINFSPGSGFFAVGSGTSNTYLYRLNHYDSY